jgi:hypothetical protein
VTANRTYERLARRLNLALFALGFVLALLSGSPSFVVANVTLTAVALLFEE